MRVGVFVDGFNLYYRALRKTPHKWLNPVALARLVLQESDKIEFVRYFTARVSPRENDHEAPKRQQIYLSALQVLPEIRIHYGSFLSKTKFDRLFPTRRSMSRFMTRKRKVLTSI